jgi:hypothetical protein
MLARDTGAPTALEFARAYPGLLGRSVLLNPHPPMSRGLHRTSFIASVHRRLLRNPDLVAAFAEFLRRQMTTPLLERMLDRMLADVPADHAALQRPEVRQFLIRDIQAMCARSTWGFASEHAVYAMGWEPPAELSSGPWSLALSGGAADPAAFDWLPPQGRPPTLIEGAGLLPQFTHPEALVALLA